MNETQIVVIDQSEEMTRAFKEVVEILKRDPKPLFARCPVSFFLMDEKYDIELQFCLLQKQWTEFSRKRWDDNKKDGHHRLYPQVKSAVERLRNLKNPYSQSVPIEFYVLDENYDIQIHVHLKQKRTQKELGEAMFKNPAVANYNKLIGKDLH